MLVLTAEQLINRGANRDCYQHPDDPTRCIKLSRSDGQGTRDGMNEIEYEHHAALADRLGEAFYQHAPRCFGLIETNQGKGPCFELIRDSDGRLSLRLKEYIEETNCSTEHVLGMIERLYDFVVTNDIALFVVNQNNLLVRRGNQEQAEMVVIDWKGPKALREFIPLSRLIPWFARSKRARRFRRLREVARNLVATHAATQSQVT